jgi:phenylacetate-coenzyme A ligase PaaK-like adenylate-forming protein
MRPKYEEFRALLDTFSHYKNYGQLKLTRDEDICSIPITTKVDLEAFDIRACPRPPVIIPASSGSTGNPLLTGYSEEATRALIQRLHTILYDILHAHPGEVAVGFFDVLSPLLRELGLCNLIAPYSNIDEREIELITKKIIQAKCTLILSPPHLLPTFLDRLARRNYYMERIAFGGIKVTEAFKTYLLTRCTHHVDVYGLTEMHVAAQRVYPEEYFTLLQPDNCYLEVLDENGHTHQEGQGILLVTDFTNLSYPIIRYCSGDIVDLRCTEGNFQFKVLGRVGMHIKIHGELINKGEILEEIEEVLQHSNYLVEIHAEPTTVRDYVKVFLDTRDMQQSKDIEERIRKRIGCMCEFYLLDRPVPKTRTNKYINIIDRRNDPVTQ